MVAGQDAAGRGSQYQPRPAEGAQGATALTGVRGAQPSWTRQSSGGGHCCFRVEDKMGDQVPLHSSPAG